MIKHDAEDEYEREELQSYAALVPVAQPISKYSEENCAGQQLEWPCGPAETGIANERHRTGTDERGFGFLELAPRLVLGGELGWRQHQQRQRRQNCSAYDGDADRAPAVTLRQGKR